MRTRAILLSIILGGAAITLLRVPFAHIDTIWAEDGQIFLQQHYEGSAWSVLFRGYAGYQHFIPRVVTALLVTVLPIDAMGVAIFIACALLTGLVAAAVFWLSRDLLPWTPARLGLAAVTLLLPLSSFEVVGNLADFHTYCLWLTPWLLLYRPRTRASAIAWGVVAFACAMTEIQSLLFAPLLLLLLRRDHRRNWPIAVGYAAGVFGQLLTTVLLPRDSHAAWPGVSSLVRGYLYNTVLPMINPHPTWEADLLLASGALVPALALIPFLLAITVVLVWGTGAQRLLVAVLVLASVAAYSAGAIVDGGEYFRYSEHTNSEGFEGILNVRYGVASGLFLAATVPLAAAVAVRVGRARALRWPTVVASIALIALALQFTVASTQAASVRGSGVAWSSNVAAARAECASLSPDSIVEIANAPSRLVKIRCERL